LSKVDRVTSSILVYYPERGVHSLNKFLDWTFLSKIHIHSDHNPLQYITEAAQRVLNSLTGHLLNNSLIARSRAIDKIQSSSYHVEIAVSSRQFMHAIGIVTMPDVWPAGVLIRRYYKSRNKDGE